MCTALGANPPALGRQGLLVGCTSKGSLLFSEFHLRASGLLHGRGYRRVPGSKSQSPTGGTVAGHRLPTIGQIQDKGVYPKRSQITLSTLQFPLAVRTTPTASTRCPSTWDLSGGRLGSTALQGFRLPEGKASFGESSTLSTIPLFLLCTLTTHSLTHSFSMYHHKF